MEQTEVKEIKKKLNLALLAILFTILCIAILLLYPDIQKTLYQGNKSLLFINNTKEAIITVVILGLLPFGISYSFRYLIMWQVNSFNEGISTKKLAIISIMLMIFGYLYQLKHYSYIDKKGIHVRSSFISEQKNYKFSDIKSSSVFVEYGERRSNRGEVFLKYEIGFNDGFKINLIDSSDFWQNIGNVEMLLENENIKTCRSSIDLGTFIEMVRKYKNGDRENVTETIEKIFMYKPNFDESLNY